MGRLRNDRSEASTLRREEGLKITRLAGAAERIRTFDPRITNAVLYRLSYRGKPAFR